MRLIYELKKLNWKIQQGIIFNKCIADNYKENVFGIVITPRCDIENAKVKTLHYLPIVEFEEWVKIDLMSKFYQDYKKNLYGNIRAALADYRISTNILNENISLNDISAIIESKITDKKKRKKVLEWIQNLSLIDNEEQIKELCNSSTIKNQIIKELLEGRNKDFYLIEDWIDTSKFRVILLREVNRISFSFAEKISKGIPEDEVTEEELYCNDINISREKDDLILIETKMNSPFIEHLIQSFFHNFGRIGVDNFEDKTNDILFKEATKTLSKQ